MNILIIILSILFGLILLLLIIAAFTKKDFNCEKEIQINQPKQKVFDYIRLLKNQDNFSKWASMDPNMKKTYSGEDGTIGFISAWESNNKNVGQGEQEIINIIEGLRIDFKIRFIKPFKSFADSYMITEELDSNQCRVKWGFESRFNYPMNLMLLFSDMDKMIGKDFLTGLTNLKNILEK
ncbi:MAG: SRPBCC family protein [Bacteroidetes bacterium]|nr:SRPBCC family protein [Bacteroidota bacterium]